MSVKNATEYTLVIAEKQQNSRPPRMRTVEGHFYTETDLKPRTTYCIRLAAQSSVSQSHYSRSMCRTTGASQ
ncbi:hypothetical protein EYF80_054829 [Liparis tanakae]|uniref:Fibronectin type-III domain-containing protein n=1 Tax=Liparis tanakae TaxID=230148 RepID=A0A4Z2F1C8_9TELE|nr:hypothetical protein EYF80_054829 [Liparis tanakae]